MLGQSEKYIVGLRKFIGETDKDTMVNIGRINRVLKYRLKKKKRKYIACI